MAKTTKTEILSDDALTLIAWPATIELRCDHAGAKIPADHEPDMPATETADGPHLVRHLYETKCGSFGKTETVELAGVDDRTRACPGCGFYRTLVAVA